MNATQDRRKGMILPFEPLSITFDNIKYSVDMPQVTEYIYFHVCDPNIDNTYRTGYQKKGTDYFVLVDVKMNECPFESSVP